MGPNVLAQTTTLHLKTLVLSLLTRQHIDTSTNTMTSTHRYPPLDVSFETGGQKKSVDYFYDQAIGNFAYAAGVSSAVILEEGVWWNRVLIWKVASYETASR